MIQKLRVAAGLLKGSRDGLVLDSELPNAEPQYVGSCGRFSFLIRAGTNLTTDKKLSRNDKLSQLAYLQIADTLLPLLAEFGQQRIAVVIGTSTSGIEYGEQALKQKIATGEYPEKLPLQHAGKWARQRNLLRTYAKLKVLFIVSRRRVHRAVKP